MSVNLIGTPSDHISPTLAAIAPHERPVTRCTDCPAAVWYVQGELRAFCQSMKMMAWAPGMEPMLACDGRETAIELVRHHESGR